MRLLRPRARNCDRVREYASRRLDGELSQFEQSLLASHLDDCPACSAFSADIGAIVEQLRTAPLESLTRPVALPARRRAGALRIGVAAAAAVAAVGAVVPGAIGLLHSHASATPSARSALARSALFAANNQDIQDIHVIRATQATPERSFILAHGRGPHPT
jgi:predicted anti-sigma-YlaC factor YlaD